MQDLLITDIDDDLMRLIEAKAKAMGISVEEVARLSIIEQLKDAPDSKADRQTSDPK